MTDNDFDRYVGMYRSSVTRAALCILRDAEEAEDIAQEVFLRLYTYTGCFDGDEHVRAWLLRCASNLSIDALRSSRRRNTVSLSEIGAAEPKRNERVSAVVYKNGAPALALYIVSKNSYRREAYVLGMNACEKAGIPALRFMKEFSNEPGYIVGRVDAVMK